MQNSKNIFTELVGLRLLTNAAATRAETK